MKNPFKKGTIKEGCKIDKNTGQFFCESKRVFEDGSEQELGRISGGLNAECNISPDEFFENEDGVIDRLTKNHLSKIKGKCRREVPQDY